ncbi:hypothetical protein Y032_0030g2142 [Ancylostoma ceylanicum]|uniref:Uncharacterized protein n=1 Tax=Ancylostoma ceylanicum TaxID=53326 RepID=A0A016USY1_9BILA|nr:hypothetical protein Y032_0030g2142 [Ancylostoma ceylanicum]
MPQSSRAHGSRSVVADLPFLGHTNNRAIKVVQQYHYQRQERILKNTVEVWRRQNGSELSKVMESDPGVVNGEGPRLITVVRIVTGQLLIPGRQQSVQITARVPGLVVAYEAHRELYRQSLQLNPFG